MSHEPLYRPVLRDAFKATWRGFRLWPVALIAGILLSGSVSDVIWKLTNALAPQLSLSSAIGMFWSRSMENWSALSLTETIFGGIRAFQLSTLFLIIAFAIAGLSVICQGALVFALGTGRVNKKIRIRDALTVGARAFWPVFVLNLLSLSVLMAVRSLLAMVVAIASNAGSAVTFTLYLSAFAVFAILAVTVAIIEILALNAMILQGATLAQAIERGAQLLRRHWVVTLETAGILFALGAASWIVALLANAVLAIPLFMLLMLGMVLGSPTVVSAALFLGIILFTLVMIAIVAAFVTLQYATWTTLFRRLGEGGAVPKIHRWVRQLTHGYHVPGA